jgi:hypothetical protein
VPRQMSVSNKEQKLSWEFMRAIESGARKGRVILVIDGVECLESRMFSRMKWLALQFPPAVRIILSITASAADVALACGSSRLTGPTLANSTPFKPVVADKELSELTRRGLSFIQVRTL